MEIQSLAIGTYLEPELIAVINKAIPELDIVYEPDILPPPRYKCDHTAPARKLSESELNKWFTVTAGVDAYFDFDWYKPEEMVQRNPGIQWIQATSAGLGSRRRRKLDVFKVR